MLLQVKELNLEYKDGKNTVHAVKNINLELNYVGFYGILGPSGSGKTSLLYLLSGIRKQTGGEILYCGYPYPDSTDQRNLMRRREMGFVFQSSFLINYLTVMQNIIVGADSNDVHHLDWIKRLIFQLGLENLEHRFPHQLSGGQRQRVAIARALANKPKIIFVDEPTASLDHENGLRVVEMLEQLSRQACIVVVTHDETILRHPTAVFRMWDGELSTYPIQKIDN